MAQASTQDVELDNLDLLAGVVAAEARPGAINELSVLEVIHNRQVKGGYGGHTVEGVVTSPSQFEAYTNGSYLRNRSPEQMARIKSLAQKVWNGDLPDITGGSTNYYAPGAQHALGRNDPSWASTMSHAADIGAQSFYGGDAAQAAAAQKIVYAHLDDLDKIGHAWRVQQDIGVAQFDMMKKVLLEDNTTDLHSFLDTVKGAPAYGVHTSISYLRGKMGLDDAALTKAGVNLAEYDIERGVTHETMSAEQTTQLGKDGITEDGKYVKDGDKVIDLSRSAFGPESKKVMDVVKGKLDAMKNAPAGSPEHEQYAKMVSDITQEVEKKRKEAQEREDRIRQGTDMSGGGLGSSDPLGDLLGMLLLAVVLQAAGMGDAANAALGVGPGKRADGKTVGSDTQKVDLTPDGSTPGAAIGDGAVTAVDGSAPKAFIIHHTAGRGDKDDVLATLRQRGLGVQYIMERDGTVYKVGGPGESQIKNGWGQYGEGLNNSNTVGMEIIAKDDSDVTPAQVEAAKKFIAKYYPNTPVFGHGMVNPGHKEATEGQTVTMAIRADRQAKTNQEKAQSVALSTLSESVKASVSGLDVDHNGQLSAQEMGAASQDTMAGITAALQKNGVTPTGDLTGAALPSLLLAAGKSQAVPAK